LFKPSAIIQHFQDLRGYIGFSFVLFFASIVVGGTNQGFETFLNGQLEGLGQLVDMVENSSNKTLFMMILIFLNNAIKSILIMYLGAFYGIIPFIFLVTNGMIIGYLLKVTAQSPEALPVWEVVVKGLLPHGIIEIPAIIFACAYGLKFGSLIFRASGSMVFARGKLGGIGKEIEHFAIRTVPMIVILIIALLIASVIESTFTVWLLE
jgi:stage II sporulation protein M